MRTVYYLFFIAAFLIFSANKGGFSTELSKWKLIMAVFCIIIPILYTLWDRTRDHRK